MNPEYDPAEMEAARARLHPALAAAISAERAPAPEAAVAEQTETGRSMLAVHRDPSLTSRDGTERDTTDAGASESEAPEADPGARRRTQVRWVRPTELAMQGGARATGWGLDLRAELAQRLRDARTHRVHTAPDRGTVSAANGRPGCRICRSVAAAGRHSRLGSVRGWD